MVHALEDVDHIYRNRLERRLDHASILVRPAAEVVVGLAVFGFAYSFLVPLFGYARSVFTQ